MSRSRLIYLFGLALLSGGLMAFVLTESVIHEAFTRGIVYALLPLLLVFAFAVKGLKAKGD